MNVAYYLEEALYMENHEYSKQLQLEIKILEQKIISYQMDLIKVGSRYNALKIQEKWIKELGQDLENQLAEDVKQKAIYQKFLAS